MAEAFFISLILNESGHLSNRKRIGIWEHLIRLSFSLFCQRVRLALHIGGPGIAAMEAGNSETITRSTYLDAKTPQEADQWFRETPTANP